MLSFFFCSLLITTVLASDVSNSLESDVFSPDGIETKFGVLRSHKKNLSLVDNLDVESKCRWEYATKSGYRIGIYDNILTLPHLKMLRGLLNYKAGSWSYRIRETHVKGGQNYVSDNDIPWYNELDVLKFSESIVGKQLQKVVTKFSHEGSMNYYPFKVDGHIMRRGDFPKVHTDADSDEGEMSMMIYLNSKWRKNDYGDLYLFDDDKEIVAGIVPRYGRIVVWQSSILYLPRPPSVAFKPGQLFLHICFTKNQTKVQDIHSMWQKKQKIHKNIHSEGFFTPEEHNKVVIPVQSHLVSEAKSKDGKRIVVFDGLFSKDDLDNLRSAILNYGMYYYDDTYLEDSDNVQWIVGLNIDHYMKSNMWKITQQVAKFVSGGHPEWFPYDISCNVIRNADTTQIHQDCGPHEDEWTFLLYLNPVWTINDYGETVFYESIENDDDNTEIITEVLPKHGRIVIFQGIIPHSARPPSTNFSGVRLSFAVKLSKNEWTARRKMFHLGFHHLMELKTNIGNLKRIFVDEKEDELGSSDAPLRLDDHQPQDYHSTREKEQSNEETSDDEEDMMKFNDAELEEIKDRLEILSQEKDKDIESLRNLVVEVQERISQGIEDIAELFQQYL